MPRLGSRVGISSSGSLSVPLLPCVHLLQHAFAAATVGDLGAHALAWGLLPPVASHSERCSGSTRRARSYTPLEVSLTVTSIIIIIIINTQAQHNQVARQLTGRIKVQGQPVTWSHSHIHHLPGVVLTMTLTGACSKVCHR
jgi:hypothetical protein